jgi:putative nucleotidyltransferase with HDIG domain
MTPANETAIRERVKHIKTTPAIPAVFLPLLKLLNAPPDEVKLPEVVKLVSYDNTIAAQCLRVASSPLFGLSRSPESIKGAVLTLGLRRVQTILMTCCLGQAFPARKWVLDPVVFWRHSLGCALVCRKFSEKLASSDHDKAYMAGLLHDIGFLVNCMVFSEEFDKAIQYALQNQVPLYEAEGINMGFTHSDTGRALAEKWHLPEEMVHVITHHHAPETSKASQSLVAIVHLSDVLCRARGLGYGYYERRKVDLVHNPAWEILQKEHRDLENIDVARFTFELDDAVEEVFALVSTIFGPAATKN